MRRLGVTCCTLLAAAAGTFLLAGDSVAADRTGALKVAFTIRFSSFVKWEGKRSEGPFRMCIFGTPEIVEHFRRLEGQDVDGRPVEIHLPATLLEATGCDLAFFSGPPRSDLTDLLRSPSVLTVSDDPSFIERGGMIRLYESGNRMRFEINPDAARQSGLRISSKLLQLAATGS